MSSTVAPEVVLAGRYRLVRRLASGGMGQVWRADDEILGRPVAVKLLRGEYAEDPEFVDRFRAEARRTAALSHPGIASVFDYGETSEPDDGTTAYLVMELVEGEPLSALLAREGRLSPAQTLDVLAQAALALDSAHLAGVVHRDVKPSNLLLRRDGVVKVTDFGIAHAADEAPRTEAGLVVGTAAYLSPEQVACRPATPASDVYALGVVAYECLAGRRPFTGEHPIALALAHRRSQPPPLPEDVPESVCELVSWTMSKAPSARPHSAGALGRQALVARTVLDAEAEAGTPRTPSGGWFPVLSGWHPALGRGRAGAPAGDGNGGGAAAPARPASAPARAERNTGAGHRAGGDGTNPGCPGDTRDRPGPTNRSARPGDARDRPGPTNRSARPGDTGDRPGTPNGSARCPAGDSRAAAVIAARVDAGAAGGTRRRSEAAWRGDVDAEATGEWAAAPSPGERRPAACPRERATPAGRTRGVPAVAAPGRRTSVAAALVAITVLLVVGVTAAARQRAYSTVPPVDGRRITVAGQTLTDAGFEVRERSRPDATVRAGYVISQQPPAGTRRSRGTLVTMVVSSGPPVVVLDPARYLGKPLAPVRASMIRLGLRVSVTGAPGRTGSGRVTAINPSGALHQGDEVTVTVATAGRRAAGA